MITIDFKILRQTMYFLVILSSLLVTACSDGTASNSNNLTSTGGLTDSRNADDSEDDDSEDDDSEDDDSAEFSIEDAIWKEEKSLLIIKGTGKRNLQVTLHNSSNGNILGIASVKGDDWKFRDRNPETVPCIVTASQENGETDSLEVENAPPDCDNSTGGGTSNGATSINSTSRSSTAALAEPVAEQPFVTNPLYQVLAVNDLGMHCGDLDTRISSILPPFNVLHAQVIERGMDGNEPRILNEGEVTLTYSAVSNTDDPILAIEPILAKDGSLYKTNFWDIARQAYAPFYPSGILELFYPENTDIVDIGLPVPDVERFYLEDGELHAGQQAMPGINGPLTANDPQTFHEHIGTLPFFINFPFGYTSEVNFSESAGIPIAVYDDFGRENPYPLMRVQAEVNGQKVATVDTVVPISGEAECQRCHADPEDGGNGAATQALYDAGLTIALASQDPAENVPADASIEWASDLNILALHDLRHQTTLRQEPDPVTGQAPNPVVCQVCHYTPALDLAQFGPLGPENDNIEPVVLNNGDIVLESLANGRDQVKHKTMSNVMHSHHATVKGVNGEPLFRNMPPAIDAQGNKRDPILTAEILGETCYACHPGNKTQCMRGAMANGGQVCQDCHGEMVQVGNDFSRGVSPHPDKVGKFELAADFYTNPETPRVPWANEPGCGSCHTGDAMDSLAADEHTMVNPSDANGNTDNIRLAQAFRMNDSKATPIVPTNKRFAENTVDEGTAADGNPKLYRVSTGHGELFCEACHGATHAEWPNKLLSANDNVASLQLQGHTGTITECTVCHEGNLENTLDGPHGMHPVGNTHFSEGGHSGPTEINNGNSCRACHGVNGEGTVLARAATERVLKSDEGGTLPTSEEGTVTIAKGQIVSCDLCHENELKPSN